MFAALGLAAALGTAARIETTFVRIPDSNEQVAIHCLKPQHARDSGVLFVHGSTFPTRLAAGYEFSPGDSWLSFVAARGYVACGLDFAGYGASSRPQAMLQPANRAPPVLRAPEAAAQIAAAIQYMHETRGLAGIHVVAHSWGTIPAATFTAAHPAELKSLILFGPVVPVGEKPAEESKRGAWFAQDAMARLDRLRFKDVLPSGLSLLEPTVDRRWAQEFVAANQHVADDPPETVRVPEGPGQDIDEAQAGVYPYVAKDVRVPVFVVYGNYDSIVNAAQAEAFLARFTSSPLRWQLQIDDGTHVMHLERNRRSLYQSVAAFVATVDCDQERYACRPTP
jgi:pimeloyl-ACP methyl ester carboxylesterase